MMCPAGTFLWPVCGALTPLQGDNEPARVEIEQQKYLSALPFLPPLTEKTLNTYYTIYAVFFGAVIVFGGLLAPLLELRLGIGGAFCGCMTAAAGRISHICSSIAW